jgi:PKD repeat protein
MKAKKILLFLLLTIFFYNGFTQDNNSANPPDTADYPYWIEMMQDQNANFYQTVRAFNIYWEDREITKGCGWKPFKRWEYMMQFRIYPNGDRLPADHDYNEYYKYLENHPDIKSFSGNWTNLGPFTIPSGDKGYNGLGRINSLAFHPTDEDIIYIGAPSGGLWKTTDAGNTWTSNTDDLPTLGVSSIIVDYSNPDIIYIGTGDRDAGDAEGIGVFKSYDGGQTWEMSNTGMGNKIVGRLIQHPTDPDMILAASSGGIYKSYDAGANWEHKSGGGNFKEIVFKADNPEIVFASANGKFYRSTDTGETWTQITSGIPNKSRGVIGVTPANPDYVYFLTGDGSEYGGTFMSVDAGLNFTTQSTTPNIMSWGCYGGSGGQAWYDLDIAIDPTNENIVYAGGVNCFKSTDCGVTWEINSHWWGNCGVPAVHADLHVFEYSPVNGRLYAGNDGGIYWTNNGGLSWPEISDGLPISQTYKFGQSATVRDLVINGYQDNGTSTFLGSSWVSVYGGDGMECAIDHTDPSYSYATLYFGSIFRLFNNANAYKVAGEGVFGIDESGAWVTPFCLHETDANVMFVGYANLWRCENVKTYSPQWENITNNFSGFGNAYTRVIEHSPADLNLLYAARDNTQFYRCDNIMETTTTWIDLSSFLPSTVTPTDVEAHPTNPDIVYITQNNKVYKSTDKGYTWEDISGTLPSTSLNTIEYYKGSSDGLYVGSNIGIFYRDNFMDDWVLFADGLPASSRITEVEIYYDPIDVSNDVIRAATYGRGLWESGAYYYQPVADFTSTETMLPIGCSIDFYDESAGIPHIWSWTFEGATPETSSEQNPTNITYLTEGTFNVTLIVTNPAGTDSYTKTGYITVSANILPDVNFIASDSVACSGGFVISFYDQTLHCPDAWQWSFVPDNITYVNGTNENSQNPDVEFTDAGAYTVSLTVTNTSGNNNLTKQDYIHIGGFTMPFTEDFESGSFSTKSWIVENPDYNITWDIDTVGGSTPGDQAAWMNFFNYYNLNARDMLISPPLDFSGYNNLSLYFEHAYTQRYNQIDSLIVYISDDCGETWTRIFEGGPDGTGVFATSPPSTSYFVPESAEDWCGNGYGSLCNNIDISDWDGLNNIKIMFESYNKFGNNLYIDNIFVSNSVGISNPENNDIFVKISPNPSNGIFNIEISKIDEAVNMNILNIQGQVVRSKILPIKSSGSKILIDLSIYPKGIYLIEFSSNKFINTEKIIIK